MRILVLPGLLPYVEALSAEGRVRRLLPTKGVPEAAWVGLPPLGIADGPLIVAALGKEPPERTMQFHLSVLGLDGALVEAPAPSPEEAAVLGPLLKRLDTKRLTTIVGEGLDHALVLDGWWDLGTTSREAALGRPLAEVLPEGDLEGPLRRFIDDSVNMLSELEINARRRDAGIPLLSVLWPWGHGAPRRLPNLALQRGEALTVESPSLRMRGMARLVGYRPVRMKGGMETDWPGLLGRRSGIAALDTFVGLSEEEASWLAERLERELGAPVREPTMIAVPAPEGGLVIELGSPGSVPFRADVAEDGSVPTVDLWKAIDSALSPE